MVQKLSEWLPVYNEECPNRTGRYLLAPSGIFHVKSVDFDLLKQQSKYAKKRSDLNKVCIL
ncbi:hypothetical protein B1H38_06555 [Leptospira borgpetersenii serovar Ballum]|nr:hypothetical protein IQ66_01790 [Leptospira borgpetersenii serovar Ballum]OOV45189.1 hypothetical protein B1H38_06555 [Leptospira borgpetersenii serovar Ballum]